MTMRDRRTFLGMAAASLLSAHVRAQTSTPPSPLELARHALSGALEGFEAVLVELNVPAGARRAGAGHRHPGPVLGYVLDGQMQFGINQQPATIVSAGSTFFEPPGVVHTTSESASETAPVRFLAFMVVPTGSPLSLPA
ncbi:MAG: cupin domain-containing protein [Vicinamibacterales bacterium]